MKTEPQSDCLPLRFGAMQAIEIYALANFFALLLLCFCCLPHIFGRQA